MRTKSCRIGIRVSEETRDKIEASGMGISEYIRCLLENVEQNKNVQQSVEQKCSTNVQQNALQNNSVSQNLLDEDDIKVLKDIGQMAKLSGSDLKSVLSSLQFKLTFNDLEIHDGELAVYKSIWDELIEDEEVYGLLSNLSDLCESRGVELGEVYRQVLLVGGKMMYADVRDKK